MTYTKINWLNKGETGAKPINKTNLNHMDDGIVNNDNSITATNNKIGNLNNLMTPQKDNLVNAINSNISEKRSIITVSTNAQTSISANSNIPFNTIYAQCGDTEKLKVYSGGGVLIGAGVSKVLVSFVVNSSSSERKWFYLRKNGVKVGDSISQTATSYHTATYSPQLFEVQDGDYFQVLNFIGTIIVNDGISNPKASFMTVEVIE